MTHDDTRIHGLLGATDQWPAPPSLPPDFHRRLSQRLLLEAAARRRVRVARVMRGYWLMTAAVALVVFYRLPVGAGMLGFFVLSASLLVPLLLLQPQLLRVSTYGELFLRSIEE